ncbi:MAG: DUF393 domain-containing protein [Rubellimicrobium sp.]|nr:DUF393 domain-containing protein [Rubellimicrobium sp.]
MSQSMKDEVTHVLYNADCPVCRTEIGHYRRMAERDALPLRFDGLEKAEALGLSRDAAARRLHVMHDGQLLSGIPAFLVLWQQMPRTRWLARLVGLPGIRQAACGLYDHVLAPMLYRAHLRRERRQS